MDSLTHIVLGAAIGELLAGRTLGKKAMLIGAAANSLPDIDFVAAMWLPTARDVWAHRGITHSILFVIVMSPLLALLAQRALPRSNMSRRRWLIFFGIELLTHIFIDAFNAYGTGWFEPFSHQRISFHVLFVADPFYSVWLGIAFVALLILKARHPARRKWAAAGLLLSTLYLVYGISNKLRIDNHVKDDLQAQHHPYTRYFSTPTPLNTWLWYVVAEDSDGFYTGYRSMFDHQPTSFRWQPKAKRLLKPFMEHPDVHYLLRFSQGFYTCEQWGDTVVFNDLRFGEMKGWEDPKARFVFHYFLQRPDANEVVVQRGRFAGWDGRTLRIFVRRIRGN
ncbi:MAG TPA: metal-dependent hydrolase [Puia sp.]|uniref:metal-dependent hydrolase n=1 Tax=Puia sp. TaxID=2045100 RepID=UPI002C8000A1|nr:metal-dependent hydrolase [Puia sp.]HVU93833.1 metal-dependent hydrolase [Puia sp.]